MMGRIISRLTLGVAGVEIIVNTNETTFGFMCVIIAFAMIVRAVATGGEQ